MKSTKWPKMLFKPFWHSTVEVLEDHRHRYRQT